MNRKEIKESLIVFLVMTAVLLPVRLFFVSFVSDNWLGSLGIISGITGLILYLTNKNKLGRFGQMFQRQLARLQKGRLAKIVFGQTIFFVLVFGTFSIGIELGNSAFLDMKEDLLQQNIALNNYGLLVEEVKQIDPELIPAGILIMIFAIFFAFPEFSVAVAIVNDLFDGWILHVYTVAFVESLEMLGLLLVFRLYPKIKGGIKNV